MRQRSSLHPILGGLLLLLLLVVPALASERGVKRVEAPDAVERHALVIGNSAYTRTSPLRNPVNDATSMTRSLQSLGFRVTTLTDSGQRAMDQAIRKFGKTLRNQGGVGLFYYAGHGMQVDGENFLLPVDIDPSTEADVRYDAVPVGKLLGQLEAAGNGMNIVILDACRNNPFARSFRSSTNGLAQVSAPSGTFISYATGPGKVAADGEGENGLFTEKLVAHLSTPGLKLEEVFKRVRVDVQRESMGKQVPWDSSSVTGDFYFAGASQQTAVAAPATAVQQAQTAPPQSPAATAASTSPEAEKLWKRHQLAKQRGLASIQQKTANALIRQHPNSDYAIRIQSEQLQSRLDRDGLTPALSADLEALRRQHSQHPAVAGLTASALPRLMARAADHRQTGQLDRAVADYQLAERWGADPATLRRHLLAVRGERVRQLIDSGNFEKAEEALLDWELSEQDTAPIPRLYDHLKQARLERRWEPKRQRILALIQQKDFPQARQIIRRWQNSGDAPASLNQLSAFLESEQQREQERLARAKEQEQQRLAELREQERIAVEQEQKRLAELRRQEQLARQREQERIAARPKRVRQLIESGQFKQAEAEFAKWLAEGVDTEKRLELAALFNRRAPHWLEPHTAMRFVEIPGGSFEIGDQFDEGVENEKTSWFYGDINIQPFRLGATEVTQAQWQSIMGNNPSKFKGDDRPVENVSWQDVQEFIRKLNARSGKRFRLPTEAEWEYACREGGRKVRFCNGKDKARRSGIHSKTKPVASFAPNSLGLYDMSGNVFEWTCSEYKESYDGSESQCAAQAALYSLRGGSWYAKPWDVRSARRNFHGPGYRYFYLGFRLVLER